MLESTEKVRKIAHFWKRKGYGVAVMDGSLYSRFYGITGGPGNLMIMWEIIGNIK